MSLIRIPAEKMLTSQNISAQDTFPHASGKPLVEMRAELLEPSDLTLSIKGRLDPDTTGSIWRKATELLDQIAPTCVVVDGSGIDYCDVSGIALFLELGRRVQEAGGRLEIRNLRPQFHQILNLFDPKEFQDSIRAKPKRDNFVEQIGRAACNTLSDLRGLITFIGEAGVALFRACLNPRQVRWKDALISAETAGINALPIIALIGFLMGLIIAFQATIPMRQFGAEIFVANLIGLSMVRELGPLMTAIVLAGRSGSAFAAELGTMKVNEEIDALTTMGLEPVRFLVVPKLIAAVAVTPLLAVFADLIGVMGGSLVLLSLGYPLVTYVNQILYSVNYVDFLGGVFKSFVFGLLVAGIGCLRGMDTGTGARAVGESTTLAVVGGIVLIVIADGTFSVIFYYLGI
jgi:phospholipid/cholesterol/gamma-HCH transport system permease protein